MALYKFCIVLYGSSIQKSKIAADLRPSADGSAVHTSLVAGGGYAAGSQRAYSLGSCTMGQTDGRTDRASPKCPARAAT